MTTTIPAQQDPASVQLQTLLDRYRAQRVLLVTGKESFRASGGADLVASACATRTVKRFYDFDANPERTAVNQGIALCANFSPDMIIAIGGGSVMDMAKLIAVADSTVEDDIQPILSADNIHRKLPLIAIPTTAGSGSEATQFAVLYIDGIKYSVDAPALLPDHSILDASLVMSASRRQSALSGVDALCQAIESFWSVKSTPQSMDYSRQAIGLILANIEDSTNGADPAARRAMLMAAHLAGKAINIARTTAPHALSYILTSRFGIPHGQAVALSLARFFAVNADYRHRSLNDPRGHRHLEEVFQSLSTLFDIDGPDGFSRRFNDLLTTLGLHSSAGELGVGGKEAHQIIADNVNPQRLNNNPVTISRGDLERVIDAMLKTQ